MAEETVHREIRVTEGTYQKINWLDHWGPIKFVNCRVDEDARIAALKRKLLIMIRGELAEFNAINRTNYFVIEYDFQDRGPDPDDPANFPVRFDARAFLFPPAIIREHGENGNGTEPGKEPEVGGHLYPPPPPPPDRID